MSLFDDRFSTIAKSLLALVLFKLVFVAAKLLYDVVLGVKLLGLIVIIYKRPFEVVKGV